MDCILTHCQQHILLASHRFALVTNCYKIPVIQFDIYHRLPKFTCMQNIAIDNTTFIHLIVNFIFINFKTRIVRCHSTFIILQRRFSGFVPTQTSWFLPHECMNPPYVQYILLCILTTSCSSYQIKQCFCFFILLISFLSFV